MSRQNFDQLVRRKGIILAGGSGTRLFPLTVAVCKQLLPVHDKPMIYYPLTTLMLAGIRDILVISTPETVPLLERLLGDGSHLGIDISFAVQQSPDGIAEALVIGAAFIGDGPVALILGDNIFYGDGLPKTLQTIAADETTATIFGYPVADPERFGVVTVNDDGQAVDLTEKPTKPASNLAVPGLYFYNADAVDLARSIQPDGRGEKQITTVNKILLDQGKLRVEVLSRGWAWLDSGTPDSLLSAGTFAHVMEQRTGLKLACPEEVAFRMKTITADQVRSLARSYGICDYAQYLLNMLKMEKR
jgi:glucose-1-phosphate thymidylyltransferase